jgi:hypothetical protein
MDRRKIKEGLINSNKTYKWDNKKFKSLTQIWQKLHKQQLTKEERQPKYRQLRWGNITRAQTWEIQLKSQPRKEERQTKWESWRIIIRSQTTKRQQMSQLTKEEP